MRKKQEQSPETGDARKPHSGKVTLGMVAAASGVSPSTVSRILNGTAVVSPEKREAIDRAIAELGFVPNPIARGLAGGRTLSIGVITQAIDSPFYGMALHAIEEELTQAGYSALFLSGRWDADEEARCVEVLRARRVDGMIVLNGRLADKDVSRLASEMPVVVTGRQMQAANVYTMDFDHFEGARMVTDHLLALGHRDIAFIAGDPIHSDSIDRLRGYRASLEHAGVDYKPALVMQGNYHEESGREACERLLDSGERFSAIFAANDQMAFGAGLALYRRGLRVPDDVSLAGVDDLLAAAHSIPPLSTVHQGAYELGRLAATALLQLLAGKTPTETLPAPRLIVRDSTGAPAKA
jgi:LacI family transcriptional regulator